MTTIFAALRSRRITTAQARVATALIEVRGRHITTEEAIRAAIILEPKITPHQIRTNYRAAGITMDLVHDAIGQVRVGADTAAGWKNAYRPTQAEVDEAEHLTPDEIHDLEDTSV